ncbi:MAG: serine hydrolase [Saprospiraceae bacterium]|nr:serine hydrolase [Saprospiraceae bacterium]
MNRLALNLIPDTFPDVRFSYSNESVQLLGILAERVIKLRGETLFNKFIFDPIGMDSTSFAKDLVGNFCSNSGL